MGRPKGSINRRTAEFLEKFEASGYTDPRWFLADVVNRDTKVLAKGLKIKRADALGLQIKAAKELAPYVASKMPTAVEITGADQMPMIVINTGDPAGAEKAVQAVTFEPTDKEPPLLEAMENVVENQPVSNSDDEAS